MKLPCSGVRESEAALEATASHVDVVAQPGCRSLLDRRSAFDRQVGRVMLRHCKFGFAVHEHSTELVHSLFDELRRSGLLKHIERVLSEIKSFAKLPHGSVCLVIDPTYYGSPNQEPVRIEMGDDVHIRWDELVRGEMAQANARGILRLVALIFTCLDTLTDATSSTKILREAS